MLFTRFCKGLAFSIAALGFSGAAAMAADGDIEREDGIVYITGDNWEDICYVEVDGDDIEIELRVYDQYGNLDETETEDYDLDDVDLIIFEGFDGDDDFWNSTPIPSIAYGGSGNDVLLGGWSSDELHGGSGNDFLAGRDGEDDLFGDGDADWLYGGSENDYLKAGTGEDEYVIYGQGGSDIFMTPGTVSWWSRYLLPVNRTVAYEDFDPQEDTEYLFWVPMVLTPYIPSYPLTPPTR